MEDYPQEYVEHNLPLVLLSGFGKQYEHPTSSNGLPRQESGTRIRSSSPVCDSKQAQQLLEQFLQFDGTDQPWNANALPGPSGALGYKVKAIGRTYTLPPRKAAPVAQPTSPDGFQDLRGSPPRSELHSPLSPLSPGSPIFPDGVFTPLWLIKHQQHVPSLFITVFSILSSGDSTQDEQLKTDINNIRTSLSRSGFKAQFSAILLSDSSILQAPSLEERLSSIRRLTSLDAKTGLFFMPPMSSQAEIATFAQNIMISLQPSVIEYYRELTKHARRKKARAGSQPSIPLGMSGAAQSLSTPGWNVRYDVKQGVFAEYRQEMDVAERHYASAIDELFNPEGVFEATPSWSPRWEEARLLCDCLALRVIRCQLWNSSTTGAAQTWFSYRSRMRDLVDRRGKGSQTYSWDAWESRWARIMAQLIERADLKISLVPADESTDVATLSVYAPPEKAFATVERVPPFQSLHHSGYWYRLAVRGAKARHVKALAIPEEDRVPPGQSPASTVANRSRNYDGYLVPDPHEEYGFQHAGEIASLTKTAWNTFEGSGQTRMAEMTKMDLARDLVAEERYADAMEILLPLWQETKWRDDDWHDIFADLLLLLRRCASHQNDPETILAATYELLGIQSPLPDGLTLDLDHCIDKLPDADISRRYEDNQRLCPVSLAFAFEEKEAHVGESLGCQLTISSRANEKATALSLSDVQLSFGEANTVTFIHDAASTTEEDFIDLSEMAKSSKEPRKLKANLTLSRGQSRVLRFSMSLREAETLSLTGASISIATQRFSVHHRFSGEAFVKANSIFVKMDEILERIVLRHPETTAVTVLPKPPKIRVLLHGLRKQYYTEELIRFNVEVVNEETDTAQGKLSVTTSDELEAALSMRWVDANEESTVHIEAEDNSEGSKTVSIPKLQSTMQHKRGLQIRGPTDPCKITIAIVVDYSLSADPSTPLRKKIGLDLTFVDPFEVKFNFGPQLHRDAWPSYFSANDGESAEQPGGISQLWLLSSQIRSIATDDIVLHKLEPVLDNVSDDSAAAIRRQDSDEKHTLAAGQATRIPFELHTRKHSLEDRRPTTVEATLAITWSRVDEAQSITHVAVPRLTLPVSEPRVLCTIADEAPPDCDATLQYHIENPSTHFLTFAVTMEASEDFGFSGPKYRTLSLAPLSRHHLEYGIVLHESINGPTDRRWIWPALQVVDSYYQKALRVQPGGPNVKVDEKQNIGICIETT